MLTRTQLIALLFVLASLCGIPSIAKAQTPVSVGVSLGSGAIAVTSDNGVAGFYGTDGLSLNITNFTTSNGTNYTDTSGTLSFIDSSGNVYSGIPVTGLTSQFTSSGNEYADVFVGYYEVSCGLFCYEEEPEYEYESVAYYDNSSDSVEGTITPGTSIQINGQPYVIADGSFSFSYGNEYQNAACCYSDYNNNYFYGGTVNLDADPADPPAPEPGTYLTMGTGVLFLVGVGRRKLFGWGSR